jgi:3-methyladenine DNA glycosylase AlkD
MRKKAAALAAEVHEYCVSHANTELAGRYARYFKEGYDAWGLLDREHEFWSARKQEWLERYRSIGVDGFFEAGEWLIAHGKFEEVSMATQFAMALRGELGKDAAGRLARYFAAGIGNWAHTDVLCGEVLGPLLVDGSIRLKALGPWRAAEFRYQRRAVPVAMLSFLKTGTEIGPLLEFLRPMMPDEERVVHQGLGWFLREAWKKYPKPVEAFLLEWKESAARLIYQYATEKMTPEAKQRFRRESPSKRVARAKAR